MDNNARKPVSIGDLYDGMVIEDNIYDSSGDILLISAGNTLSEEQIERMQRLNNGSDKIYVSGRTLQAISSKKPNIPIPKLVDIEEASGYVHAHTNIKALYAEIQSTKKVDKSGFETLAADMMKILNDNAQDVIISLVNAIAPVDEHVERHMLGVTLLSGLLGKWLGLNDEKISKLILIGLVHDCGHALIPQELLHSPRKFTRLDFEAVKMHPVHANALLSEFPDDIRVSSATHHERLDASGYPKCIPAAQIDEMTRIIAVADIYEGIVTARAFRAPRSPFFAMSLFNNMASVQTDGKISDVLLENLPGLLADKTVTMSDGTIGIIREFNAESIQFPKVEISKRITATSDALQPVSMYLDD